MSCLQEGGPTYKSLTLRVDALPYSTITDNNSLSAVAGVDTQRMDRVTQMARGTFFIRSRRPSGGQGGLARDTRSFLVNVVASSWQVSFVLFFLIEFDALQIVGIAQLGMAKKPYQKYVVEVD